MCQKMLTGNGNENPNHSFCFTASSPPPYLALTSGKLFLSESATLRTIQGPRMPSPTMPSVGPRTHHAPVRLHGPAGHPAPSPPPAAAAGCCDRGPRVPSPAPAPWPATAPPARPSWSAGWWASQAQGLGRPRGSPGLGALAAHGQRKGPSKSVRGRMEGDKVPEMPTAPA